MEFTGTQPYAVARASADERMDFIRKTYVHLAGAVVIFAFLAALFVNSQIGQTLSVSVLNSRFGWLLLLGAFMLVGNIAHKMAYSGATPERQYMGLGLYILAEAIIFTPILFVASVYSSPDVIPTAAMLTTMIFGGLTFSVFFTRKDFSFMAQALRLGGFAAMGLIVVSILFGFNLGSLFAAAMVALAAGYILYETSNILHRYPTGAHVAAALALFASVALMFFYILRLVMNRR